MYKITEDNEKMLRKGFTLAEVLITLAIIGIVAALTIPTLISKYQKSVTVNKLKQTYSLLLNSVKLSEIDNGPVQQWDMAPEDMELWLNKYITPYVKSTPKAASQIILANGVLLSFSKDEEQLLVNAFLDGKTSGAMSNKNRFRFYIGHSTQNNKNCQKKLYCENKSEVIPYDYTDVIIDRSEDLREYMLASDDYGCKTGSNMAMCTALIMHDGWKISDDYPW